MANIIISPSKYVQGKGEMENLGKHFSTLGKKLFVIISSSGEKRFSETIKKSFEKSEIDIHFAIFNGECSKVEIDRLSKLYKETGCNGVVGVGGGKILDTAKSVAHFNNSKVAVVPTIASTDAPCSALSVLYTEDGVFDKYLFLPSNPNCVVVDTDVVSNAPVRLLVSGMGDALATYFEARAAKASNSNNFAGGKATLTAMAIAELCYKTLMTDGLKAKIALEAGVCTKSVENIIEANTFLSGIGFESVGIAAAHAIHNGMTVLEECHHLYHGEKVAFGTLAQLVLENAPNEELEKVIEFCMSVGLPTTLEDLGVTEINKEKIMGVANATCAEGETVFNMPMDINPEVVYAAIMGADAIGRYYK
ncbi:MAG: glycerol dehydrogenase [Proteocatella sp.]